MSELAPVRNSRESLLGNFFADHHQQPEFDPAKPNGGNSLDENVNAPYAGLEFHYTYLIFCAFIVWLIIPGIGLLYAGLARRKSSLALLFQSLMVCGV